MNSKIQYKVCSSIVSYFSFRLFFFNKVISKLSDVILQLLFSLRPKIPLFGCISTMYYFIYYDLVYTYFKEENYLLINGWRGRQACRLLLMKYTKKEKKYFCTLKIEM